MKSTLFSFMLVASLGFVRVGNSAPQGDHDAAANALLRSYDVVRKELIANRVPEAQKAATALAADAAEWLKKNPPQQRNYPFVDRMKKAAEEMASAGREKVSATFGDLSARAIRFVKRNDPLHHQWFMYECEPLPDGQDRWLQPEGDTVVKNPYAQGPRDCGHVIPWHQNRL